MVENAEAGLQAMKDRQFDVILSDLRLPGINGLYFLKLTSATHYVANRFLITACLHYSPYHPYAPGTSTPIAFNRILTM